MLNKSLLYIIGLDDMILGRASEDGGIWASYNNFAP